MVAVATATVAVGATMLALPTAGADTDTGQVRIDGSFADPTFLKAGKTYYAYATGGDGKGGGFPYATAPRMSGPWTRHHVAMPDKPAWVAKDSGGDYRYWAPSVFRHRSGRYVMYFTANKRKANDRCIGAAVAKRPGGPFTARKKPMVCVPGSEVIDAAPYRGNGQRYVIYKVNNGEGRYQIRVQKVGKHGTTPYGRPKVLITRRANIEAPDAVRHGNHTYLFVSEGSFVNCTYRTVVYRAKNLTSDNWKRVNTLMTSKNTGRCGPGGAEVRRAGGQLWMVFHAWKCPRNTACATGRTTDKHRFRAMLTATIGWGPHGPRVT